MFSTCIICQKKFHDWPAYNEHLSLAHGVTHRAEPMKFKIPLGDIATLLVVAPKDLSYREYKPMNPVEKRRIVAAFEQRLGAALIGALLVMLGPFLGIVRADECVGSECVGTPGPVGPQGPAGPQGQPGNTGPQGPQGIQGSQGSQGSPGGTGSQGRPGLNGSSGLNGANGKAGTSGTNGNDGKDGMAGPQGKAGDDGLNATRENIGVTVRWYDWQHFSITSGYKFDVNHHGQEIDMAILNIKLGKSWEERKLDALHKELDSFRRMFNNESNVIDASREKLYQ